MMGINQKQRCGGTTINKCRFASSQPQWLKKWGVKWIWLNLLLFLSTLATWGGFQYQSGEKIRENKFLASSQVTSILPELPYQTCSTFIRYIVKSGDNFSSIFSKFNISSDQTNLLHRELVLMGFSKLFPGDSLIIATDLSLRVKSLSLLSKFNEWYHLSFGTNDSLYAKKEPLTVTKELCLVRGTLNSSLSEDLGKLDVGDGLVVQVAEIFAWDINFFQDPQRGDTFTVLFEKILKDGKFIEYGRIIAAKYVLKNRPFYAFAIPDSNNNFHYYDENGKSMQKPFLKAPLQYNHISSRYSFSRIHPIYKKSLPHLGVDYAAPKGTPVQAACDGTVKFAGTAGGFGNQVIISHAKGIETFYGHLHSISSNIHTGTKITQGQLIGTVGSTGTSTGPHLDYRIAVNTRFVNPLQTPIIQSEAKLCKNKELFAQSKLFCLFQLEQRLLTLPGCYVLSVTQPSDTAYSKSGDNSTVTSIFKKGGNGVTPHS